LFGVFTVGKDHSRLVDFGSGDYLQLQSFRGFLQNLQYSIGLSLQVCDASDLQVLARLSDCNVYTTLNARSQFRAPTEFGLCLTGGREALRCLACESERARTCWLTAMRLAKVSEDC
jgi:hypothetical protein